MCFLQGLAKNTCHFGPSDWPVSTYCHTYLTIQQSCAYGGVTKLMDHLIYYAEFGFVFNTWLTSKFAQKNEENTTLIDGLNVSLLNSFCYIALKFFKVKVNNE